MLVPLLKSNMEYYLELYIIMSLESKIYVGTRSGSFTLNIDKGDAWNFRYVWLNLNSTSLEEALSIVGKYKNILYDVISSGVPASIYGKEERIHIMFNEPSSNIAVIDEAVIRIVGLNITDLKLDNAVLIIEIANPVGQIVGYELKSNEKNPHLGIFMLKY